jgi:dynein heavy chain
MSADLDAMGDALYTNLVPGIWQSVAYPSLMPLMPWVNDLVARASFLQKWVDEGTPKAFWISGFFFPQAFLTGSLQNYARKSGHPVDGISFAFSVMAGTVDAIEKAPSIGIYIYGMFLQGCRWDAVNYTLADSHPKVLFSQFPPMWLEPTYHREMPEEGIYKCPVYKVLTRRGTLSTTGHSTNYVMPVELPTSVAQKKWVKAGVALFTALDY